MKFDEFLPLKERSCGSRLMQLFWRNKAALTCTREPPPALRCWFYKGFVTDGYAVWESKTALGAGMTANPSVTAATLSLFQLFIYCYREGQGWLSWRLTGELSCVSWQSREGFVAAWGSLGSCAAATSSLAQLQVRETCLFSHLQLESTQPVEKGQVHIQYSLQTGARSTSEAHRKEEDFVLGSTWKFYNPLPPLCCLKYQQDARRSSKRHHVTERYRDDRAGRGKNTEKPASLPNEHMWKMGSSVLAALPMLKHSSGVRNHEPVWGPYSPHPSHQHL